MDGKYRSLVAGIILAGIGSLLFAGASWSVPKTIYETVIPGYHLSSGRGVAVDDEGNAYVIARYITNGVRNDILIARIDADGEVAWTVGIPGDNHDYATGITLDGAGDVYVTGWTDSENFPVVDPLPNLPTGVRDAFVMKLARANGSILYSTRLGGSYTEEARDITVSPTGTIFVVGKTRSFDFPVVDAYQDAHNAPPYGRPDGFITEISADGSTILYSTYLGGADDDVITEVLVRAGGEIVIVGETQSDDFPTMSPIQPFNAGGMSDVFIAELAPDGSALTFSTYLGGEDWDRMSGLASGPEGSIIIAGTTRSVLFPTTPGVVQETFVGEVNGCEVPFGADYNCEDVFVARLSSDGGTLEYGTFLAGTRPEECRDLAVDALGRVYVVGYTNSPDFPLTGATSAADIFVTRLSPDATSVGYTVFTDSGSANAGHGIAVSASGEVVFTGAINVPADIYVSKLSSEGIVDVVDGEQSGFWPVVLSVANPLRGESAIRYTLASAGSTRLSIYDAQGRLVRTLTDRHQAAGPHAVLFDGTDDAGRALPAGVFFVRLEAPNAGEVTRFVLTR